jgi:TATA-box binding protein (TBP) (component of TFIID and TFIIIB)
MEPSKYTKPTPYRISTITATGCVGTPINLDILYSCLEVTCSEDDGKEGIVYVEYGKKKSETIFKGYSKKFAVNRRKTTPTKRFDNQVTIVYRTCDQNNLNIKTFRNGNIQVTGIKSINQGYEVVDKMIEILKNLHDTKDKEVVENAKDLRNIDFKIRLINTDYKVGFSIKRENLHKILKNEYGLVCNYEPVIYPGVKLHYFYNKSNPHCDGICTCSKKCHDVKGGEGDGDMNCKKITIAIFQSGCIIITGSQTQAQIDECYSFINTILYDNVDRIEKKVMVPFIEDVPSSTKKIVLIPKSKIQYA